MCVSVKILVAASCSASFSDSWHAALKDWLNLLSTTSQSVVLWAQGEWPVAFLTLISEPVPGMC